MLNYVVITGRLTKDVESFKTKSGEEITSFSLAINSKEDYVEYIDCVARSFLTNAVKDNLVKGDKIAVSGRLAVENYQKQDGSKGVRPKIYVDNIEFIDVLKFTKEPVEEKPAPQPKPTGRRG